MSKKQEIKFYQTDFTPFKVTDLFPKLGYSKNVQGWFFTRNYILTLFRYAITLSLTTISDLSISREKAHRMNVANNMFK